ncbi:NAD-glutamate dehydrogenase, partial [Rhizobiaceae sp. 2RAB30]
YAPADLEKAAGLAWQAVSHQRKGSSVVAIDNGRDVERQGRPVTVITVVNDNMPFLFDSILGEVTDSAGEAMFVVHPVLAVKRGRDGISDILGDGAHAKGDADRVSVIHVHVAPISDQQAAGLRERLEKILDQVRAAITDWKPMLARLDQAISEFRYAPVPLDKDDVGEAIAFLEWLRDDNFTFLGMREFKYSGGEKSGTLERADKPGLGILADPDVLVLRRGTEAVTTTPEIRAFLHG